MLIYIYRNREKRNLSYNTKVISCLGMSQFYYCNIISTHLAPYLIADFLYAQEVWIKDKFVKLSKIKIAKKTICTNNAIRKKLEYYSSTDNIKDND